MRKSWRSSAFDRESGRGATAIDRETAAAIRHCLDRYLAARAGDVKHLRSPLTGYRLRCGDYRLFLDLVGESSVRTPRVRNRRDAYR